MTERALTLAEVDALREQLAAALTAFLCGPGTSAQVVAALDAYLDAREARLDARWKAARPILEAAYAIDSECPIFGQPMSRKLAALLGKPHAIGSGVSTTEV